MILKSIVKLTATLATVIAAAGLAVGYERYTRPDLTGRSTRDLQTEAVSLRADHFDDEILLQFPSIQRQKFIVDELARRMNEQILLWRMDEMAEERTAESGQPPVAASGVKSD